MLITIAPPAPQGPGPSWALGLLVERNLPFEQTLQFLSQRRPAVCPNDGFQKPRGLECERY